MRNLNRCPARNWIAIKGEQTITTEMIKKRL